MRIFWLLMASGSWLTSGIGYFVIFRVETAKKVHIPGLISN